MKTTAKLILSLFLSVTFSYSICAQKVNYRITVSLNEKDKSLDGFLTLNYTNTSSDSVYFVWFNLYPNAFKSDRTAFSEYMLSKGRTDFYFSNSVDRGYINRLDFRSGDNILKTEDHPQYIDIIKVILDKAVAPGASKEISTPFHVKLPHNFDGIGYKSSQYELRYWYPAVAEYVRPLTDAGSSSNVIADYHVQIACKKKFEIKSPHIVKRSSSDSLVLVSLDARSVKDMPITITDPYTKQTSATASNKHDIFKFLTEKDTRSYSSSGSGSPASGKLNKIINHPVLPAIGYNEYDGFQLGFLAHSKISEDRHSKSTVKFYGAPLYSFRSRSVAGIAGASFNTYPDKYLKKLELGFTTSGFSYNDGIDVNNEKVFAKLIKFAPFIQVTLPAQKAQIERAITFKTYIMSERDLIFSRDSVSGAFHQEEDDYASRYVNELSFEYSSGRVLYPYHGRLQAQQGNNWYRLNAEGNYFFNYPKGGGMNARVFAAKFGYIGSVSSSEKLKSLRYMPKLTAVRGREDYTYSNYFIGRNEFDGFPARQIMMRDGGLKLRTDLFEGLQGRSDDWIASVNLNTTLPVLPARLPLKVFFDAGTYSEAWDNDNANPRFLYVAGLQLSLFKEILNIYAPVFYSKVFRDQLKTVPEENKFFSKVSFSLDIQKINVRKLF